MSALRGITDYLDNLLLIKNWEDSPRAQNGLQVENSGNIRKIAAAVDANEVVINQAARSGASLLIVHHGLFWNDTNRWIDATYRKMRTLISADLGIYSVHLPLDGHPEFGNNVLLARACGFINYEPFLEVSGMPVGVRLKTRIQRGDLLERVTKAVGGGLVQLAPGGPEECCDIAIMTGSAGSQVAQAASEGIDTLITGEGPHWTYSAAEEAGVNLIYAGHYATETFGVKAIAKHISDRFQIPWIFIDHPSGR